jgi:hypothetical protein
VQQQQLTTQHTQQQHSSPSQPLAGSSRSFLSHEQTADMAPLMAQPGSSRVRWQGSTSGTPRAVGSAASHPGSLVGSRAPLDATAPAGGERSAASSGRSTGGAAAAAAMLPPRPAATSAGGAAGSVARAMRPSSGGGSSTGGVAGYWGSSAGSHPVSAEHSQLPTPRWSEQGALVAPHRTGVQPVSGSGSTRSAGGAAAVSTPDGTGATGAADTASAAGSCSGTTQEQPPESAAAGASAGGGVVLASGPPPCMPSAAAAAATSFMTMRPAHLYRSISTGEEDVWVLHTATALLACQSPQLLTTCQPLLACHLHCSVRNVQPPDGQPARSRAQQASSGSGQQQQQQPPGWCRSRSSRGLCWCVHAR